MLVKLERDTAGKFAPAAKETLLANRKLDWTETKRHSNEPLSTGSFLDAALEGQKIREKAEKADG